MILRLPSGDDLVVASSLASPACLAVRLSDGAPVWRYDFPPTADCRHGPDGLCRPADGRAYFTEDAVCRSYATPLLIRPEGGDPLVVVGNNAGRIVVLDAATGASRFEDQAPGMVRGSAVFGRLMGGQYSDLVIPAGASLRLYAWDLDAPPTHQFKQRADHLGADRAPSQAGGPARRANWWLAVAMAWRFGVVDALRHGLIKLDEKLLRPLGLKLIAHGY